MSVFMRIPLSLQAARCAQRLSYQSLRRFSVAPSLPSDIDFQELKNELNNDAVTLIDVRIPKELLNIGMIPKSKNIVLQTLGQDILLPDNEFLEQYGYPKPAIDEAIVVSCLAGVRARTAQLALLGAGYKNVRVYKGSYEDWLENGGPVIYPEPEPEPAS